MDYQEKPIIISDTSIDKVVVALKGTVGSIPLLGPLVAELIGAVIPNQRIDRIAKYVQILEEKLADLDQELVKVKFRTPAFIDLFEDSLYQAVRAHTDERLHYIAFIITNGLTDEEEEYEQYRFVLRLIGELLDSEILNLYYYSLSSFPTKRDEYFEIHKDTLRAGAVNNCTPQDEVDKAYVNRGFKQHLVQLELLAPKFRKPKKDEIPEFDYGTGMIKASGYKLSPLGRLLLRQIGLDDK